VYYHLFFRPVETTSGSGRCSYSTGTQIFGSLLFSFGRIPAPPQCPVTRFPELYNFQLEGVPEGLVDSSLASQKRLLFCASFSYAVNKYIASSPPNVALV
jgi:hypothetical protein